MSIEVTMPRLSDTMETGTIIKWNVGVGDEVSAGDVVADIETDKATMEMQVFDDGVVAELLIDEGRQVPVGTLIAVLAEEGESTEDVGKTVGAQSSAPDPASAGKAAEKSSSVVDPAVASTRPASGSKIKASPVARRIAAENGLDLSVVTGSGPGGRIIKRDVLARLETSSATAAEGATSTPTQPQSSPASSPLAAGEEELSGVRQTIARRLLESKTTIPHYQVSMSFDMEALLDAREQVNARLASEGLKVSVNDFIVKACALAMHDHKYMNASFSGDRITLHGAVNIGIAISLPEERGGGLVVGTIRNVDQLSLRDIGSFIRSLAEKARSRGLAPEDMSDSTFTVSNLGMFGVDHFTAIINPPNSAILACGASIEQPVVLGGKIVPGVRMTATLSLDHRVVDGAMAARYLQTLKGLIEKPVMLLI
jgi:pyruvate dehydrogenase E2 component (dihydrolipoamide acetyltransferase)